MSISLKSLKAIPKILLMSLVSLAYLIFAIASSGGGEDSPAGDTQVMVGKPSQIENIDCNNNFKQLSVLYETTVFTYSSDPNNPQPVQYGETSRVETSEQSPIITIRTPINGEFFYQIKATTECSMSWSGRCPSACAKKHYRITSPRLTYGSILSFFPNNTAWKNDGETCCN